MKKIIFAVGGTGGHLKPAQQLALRLKGKEVLFAGKGLVCNSSFMTSQFLHQEIVSAPLKKPWLLAQGVVQSLALLRKFSPDAVVGFGSYHAFPVLLAARLLRVPIYLFEPNCTIGRVNRFFVNKAKAIACQFPLEKQYAKAIAVAPLPWEQWEKMPPKKARALLGLDEDLLTFLIFGGSQGASFINESFSKAALRLNLPFQVIHLAGNGGQAVLERYKKHNIRCFVRDFEKDMPTLFAAADMAVCRSGAGTLSELIYFGLPALMIPYPGSIRDHQERNADFFTNVVKGGVKLAQKDNIDFAEAISSALELLPEMRQNILNFQQTGAAQCKMWDLLN